MSAKITKITGSVKIQNGNKIGEGVPVQVGTPFNAGEILVIGEDSSVEVTCPNGTSGSKTAKGSYGLDDICPNRPPRL